MVRETRHLWVGNLPDNIREDRIREHFKRYGRVQSVKLLPRVAKEEAGEATMACTVAFMDIKSASKAHTAEHKIDDRTLTTEYYEPAAIPSSATSPQNTPSSYSTSPGSTRFPNGHGSSDEHGPFNDRFYDRANSRTSDTEFVRRASYPDSARRPRAYGRNGPTYNSVAEGRPHRPVASWSSYDATRYNSGEAYSQGDDRRTDAQNAKKKTKSRSGSRSPSAGSTSSRSPSRSRSRSSSSSSSSSTSRATSSTGSPKSRRLATSGGGAHQPVVHSEDRRPLAICVKNLPIRSSDTSLKDGLFHEYKKHGKVTWVKVVGQSSERHAIVCFKKPEDVEKALEVSYDKMFFGSKIEVAPYQGYDVDDNDLRPYEADIDEFHPKATRTLFIGNLEKDVTASDLRKHFDQFGEIIEIDIKKQGAVSSYAFCQYSDIVSVVKAIRSMDGEHLGNNRVKLGFGKSMPTNCVWVDGVADSVTEKYLMLQFDPFGVISQVLIDRDKGQALIFYEQVLSAQSAVIKMRGASLRGRKIQVDFASRECQEAFYEHLEKQGHILDRSSFEERRDSSSRSFDSGSLNAVSRFSRYDTPTRPRTSSYSSRSSAAASNAVPSPGTPGSCTPRGAGSRSRIARFADYYDQPGAEYADRHFRSYDEYSQGSAASHEDFYDHEHVYNHDSPQHLDVIEARSLKDRVHLIDPLEDCASSGDELISSKKRLKLDLLDGTNDVIIEANRDHRKVMEVRRLSDVSLKHHSRRPSVDSKHSRDLDHSRSTYVPHTVCKRRKTGGSDSGSRVHHYDHSGSESIGGSRPGTPLCDERPEHFTPSEPRRIPREREGPLTLPLPKFAAHVLNRGSVSVAGIKGQKENVLSSPPSTVTSPRVTNTKPPSPVHVPPPASPPPRPPSLSSNSSDSDIASPSQSLDERIKSLDEKYEKWSGSRALSAAGNDALAKLDANSQRFRFRHKLLDLDLKELQPSEIVKSVMAKRSVFDEDSKRLENVGEKYEPREYALFPRGGTSVVQTAATSPSLLTVQSPKVATTVQLPKTPTMLSPRSTVPAASMPTAKSLQYPFPSHPPLQPTAPSIILPTTSASAASPAPPPPPPPAPASASTTNRGSHGDNNRLKPCVSASSDNRTPSKVSVNRTNSNSALISGSLAKTNDKGVIIPSSEADVKPPPPPPKTVTSRRDSSGSSPRCEVKTRRNSDTGRKFEESAEQSEEHKREQQRLEKIRLENEKLEREKAEKERLEKERLERERIERERLEKEREIERLEKERQEKERIEKEKAEKERQERERLERERRREREERERREKEEKERREREEQERRERREREERERREREERERREREEREKREHEEKERKEREERERKEREEKERQERERKEEERERLERERERKREKEEERKHKDDNHEKRKDDHSRHRENHSESRHVDFSKHDNKNTKDYRDDRNRENPELSKNCHDKESKSSRHHTKDSKDNAVHKNCVNEVKEHKDRPTVESRHMSLDLDKKSSYETSPTSDKPEANRRKERNNSLPTNIGNKRRLSSHDTSEGVEEKRLKLSSEYKKLSERRDSKDEKSKNKHKNGSSKTHDDKSRIERHNSIREGCDEKKKDRDKEDRHKSKQAKLEKQKIKKNRDKETGESPAIPTTPPKEITDKDFMARLDLRSTEEIEKQKQQRKETKERKKSCVESEEQRKEENKRPEDRRKEKYSGSDKKPHDDSAKSGDDRSKSQKKDRVRKMTQNSSDNNTDSDEPKKHSIFDIVDDEPAYISMYDKVKARSCKNMQKQEEEKRQEKIKAKFSQLKQSRAKREEKKRSTSWDEDSDSDRERHDSKSELKMRRSKQMLIASSDDEEHVSKSRVKHESFADSDAEKPQKHIKQEYVETSEDDRIRAKNAHRKGSRSRIASDTSDDEFKKIRNRIKSEIFSDNEVEQNFADTEEKPFRRTKEEYDDKYIKKERKISKQQESLEQISAQIFGDSNSPLPDIKQEKFNNRLSCPENSSADESMEMRKEKSEMRKKHKKKQKRQKNCLENDELSKIDSVLEMMHADSSDKIRHLEKKRQHSKKEKRKDKNKEEDKTKDKSKKLKKNRSDPLKSENKHEGKMEHIFGSLSEDSENGAREQENQTFIEQYSDENVHMSYASDSDATSHEKEEKERLKEEHKKRKEKRRREKERRLREEMVNENSMDYADMGKLLEENIKDDATDISEDTKSLDVTKPSGESTDRSFSFQENSESQELSKEARKELKEKKKKRKKSKEEKQNRHHHHHHHHDKNKIKSPETKKEEREDSKENQSLPNILDMPSPPQNKPTDYPQSPVRSLDVAVKTSVSKEKKRDKLIPGFGTEIDEKIHENAVKSISEFEPPKQEVIVKEIVEETKPEKTDNGDEKPRVVISQEETEDAVAALLGESFGGSQYSSCYEEELNQSNDQVPAVNEENLQQDDEEMRQAVQSLNTSDIEIKPDTPQSENDLQIDTDTEENEEVSVRYDQLPKTPDMTDLSQPPKTPDIPNYYRPEEKPQTHIIVKATPNIGSPPSLTPLKPLTTLMERKNIENITPVTKSAPCLPLLAESPKTKEETVTPTSVVTVQASTVVTQLPSTASSTITPPVVKISEIQYPPLTALSKTRPADGLKSTPSVVSPKPSVPPLTHNLPARVQTQPKSEASKAATTHIQFSRLPITPVMVSKALQPTTVILPQAKTVDPAKLVSTAESRQSEQPAVVYQPSTTFSGYLPASQRVMLQTNVPQRSMPQQTLLIPAKKLPTSGFGYMPSIVPPVYSLPKMPPATKEQERPSSTPVITSTDSQKFIPTSVVPVTSHSTMPPQPINSNPPVVEVKPFTPVIQETPKAAAFTPVISEAEKPVVSMPVEVKPLEKLSVKIPEEEEVKSQVKSELKTVLSPRVSTPGVVVTSPAKEVVNSPVKSELPSPKPEVIPDKPSPKPESPAIEENNPSPPKDSPEESVKTEEKPSPELILPVKQEVLQEPEIKQELSPLEKETLKIEIDSQSVIKETEKFEEEKADTESVISDTSKERSSAEILNRDDGLDSKEDSDYWSAKEVNIDSVIKTLCSADELSDRSSEVGKDEWLEEQTKTDNEAKLGDVENKEEGLKEEIKLEGMEDSSETLEDKEEGIARGRRTARGRGRKTRGGLQTRRSKASKEAGAAKRGGRITRLKAERTTSKSESEVSTDIYEFRDDSDENNTNKDRPRLILTIKSPAIVSTPTNAVAPAAVVKEVTSPPQVKAEGKEDFVSPPSNTRKSRRLQEKDVSRNTVDDTIEDVVRNTAIVTRSSSAASQAQATTPRRSTRATTTKPTPETPRKSPRGGRKKDRRGSETTDDSSEEKPPAKPEPTAKPEAEAAAPKESEKPKETVEEKVETPKEKPHEGLKATVLRRIKGEMNQEPMTLIDPVTGLLTQMRECEEGKYIPVPGAPPQAVPVSLQQKTVESVHQPSVITTPQVSAAKQTKPQSFKAHVLSSQEAKAVVNQVAKQQQQPPVFVPKSTASIPVNQTLNVNVGVPTNFAPIHLSPRPGVPKQQVHVVPKPTPPPMSPGQVAIVNNPPKIFQQVGKPGLQKAHLPTSQPQPQVLNIQMAHAKPPVKQHQPVVAVVTKTQAGKPLTMGPTVASPSPLKQQPMKGVTININVPRKNIKVEISNNSIMAPRSNLSPQAAPRHVMQPGMHVPDYEGSLHGDRTVFNRSRSPPPAHQNPPSPQAEVMTHFPPGSVQLRPPHDLPPAHYMHHPSHVMYQQYLRQTYHMARGMEKPGDGQEGEEAPVTSPPLELRRPGSVGLALTGRSPSVPHALQSPHDRTTDSPQIAQVYNTHPGRVQHFHSTPRFYDQAEPPPAHRPLTSLASLALGPERPLSHLTPMGTPDRPLSSHSALMAGIPEKPLSTHLPPLERPLSTHLPSEHPLSSHGLGMGGGLGAAGNFMGAVARHIGAEAPTSQRGLQAATPPHASQVPPQAESLLMLLRHYPCMWQGLLALKNDQAAVQMYFVSGNDMVARTSLPKNIDGSTPPLRIFQRMRLEQPQVEGVARKMQMENEHCVLLALPCGHDHVDVLKQSTNLSRGFIHYLQQKQAAGIINIAAPGTTQPAAYVVHVFPSCDFVNENLRRIAPSLLERVSDIPHLLIVITTV